MHFIGHRIFLSLGLFLGTSLFAQDHGSHGSHGSSSTPVTTAPSVPGNKKFPVSIDGLSEGRTMSEVRLADGESYILEAKPVKQKIGSQWIRRLAYNGSVPGPILRVQQGASVKVTLKNSTELATTLHPRVLTAAK